MSRRIAHFCIQSETPGIGEAGAVGLITSDFEEVTVLGEDPTVGCGGERKDGKDLENISGLDLDGFIRWGSKSAIKELCCRDYGTHAGGNEGESNEPTVTRMVGHRLAESHDEDHDSLGEENDDQSDGRVQHSLLCLSRRVFIAEADDDEDAADDDGGGCKDAEEVRYRIDGIEDDGTKGHL